MQASPAADIPIMARLKSATRLEHQALEKQVYLTFCSTHAWYYRSILAAFLGFLEPVERLLCAVDGLSKVLPDVRTRMRAALLQRDLLLLGLSAAEIYDLRRCPELPAIHSVAQALGCLYVLEGSTLGGQIIVRRIREADVIDPMACSYFLSHGDRVGFMWTRFASAVETYAATHSDARDVICSAAKEMFRCWGAWLADCAITGAEEAHS